MRFFNSDSWIPMFCRSCNSDVDVPRMEHAMTGGLLHCDDCGNKLAEIRSPINHDYDEWEPNLDFGNRMSEWY